MTSCRRSRQPSPILLLSRCARTCFYPKASGLRFGVGVGTISEIDGVVEGSPGGAAAHPIQDGSAWWAAREAIERAHALQDEGRSYARTWLRIHSDAENGSGGKWGEREGLVNSLLILRDQTVFRFQPRQRRMMAGLLMGGDPGRGRPSGESESAGRL